MSDPPPEACEVCGESPVEIVLYPVAVHYKGSGFYTTDYGRGSRKAKTDDAKSGDSSGGETKSDTKSDSGSSEKKAAAAD